MSGPLRAAIAFALGAKHAEAPTFLIARCEEADEPLASALTARGARVLRLPLLATEPGPDMEKLAAWLETPREGDAVAWTSRRAAEALVAAALPEHAPRLRALPLFALGAESAAPALRAGLTVSLPEDAGDARRLAAFIAGAPGGPRRVAVLHGDRALPDLREGLAAAGLEVDAFEVYRIRFVDADLGEVSRALARGALWAAAFLSPSGFASLQKVCTTSDAASAILSSPVCMAGLSLSLNKGPKPPFAWSPCFP